MAEAALSIPQGVSLSAAARSKQNPQTFLGNVFTKTAAVMIQRGNGGSEQSATSTTEQPLVWFNRRQLSQLKCLKTVK